jgi:hypothetical protein
MKVIEVISTTILFLLPIAPASAQEKREPEKQPAQKQEQPARPAQQQAKPAAQPAKPAAQPQRAQAPERAPQPARPVQQQSKPAQQPQRTQAQQPARPAQQQSKPAQPPQRAQAPERAPQAKPVQQQGKPAQEPQRAQVPQQAPQRANSVQASAGRANAGGRIPDDRFRASFGSGHTFHVNRAEFAGGSRRFQYGGYWFAMVNPWPVAWLYTDDVYVDYINGGYFLCDPVHPGVFLSINVG